MKLLTHNFLSSAFLKNVMVGYPLILNATKVEHVETEFDPAFVKSMMGKVEYPVLISAAKSLPDIKLDGYPEELPSNWESNEEFLHQAHELLNCINVVEGELECPESGRKFTIRDGIPNMLANEDEVDD
uniref:Multifunctional methyltransferase subunit TRM112-like protein n=1 Tax=Panagrolaimus sp. JU765 TaxID=591449 RepID=A0AC34R4C1_9BILA